MTFTLEKADSKEFARWWVVYRNTNEDFSQSFAEQYVDIEEVPFCHWIMQDGLRVGGIIMVNNNVGDFFLIAPFTDAYAALKAILPAEGQFNARNILSEHVHAFQMLGFQITESRRWMLRPTQAYDNTTPEFRQTSPELAHTDAIAQLMFDAFHGSIGEYGQRDVEAHRKSIENYFETIQSGEICHQASSVLFDGDTMIAVCLMQPYKSLATVRFVVTHPEYQKRGLGKQLMMHGINHIKDVFDYIGLAVTIGNPAEGLYHAMGFLPGAMTHTLIR